TWLGTLPLNVSITSLTLYANDMNISYFVGVDADENFPQMFLIGDHNMGFLNNGAEPTTDAHQIFGDTLPFAQQVSTNAPGNNANNWVGWGDNQHVKNGDVALTDGSASTYTVSALQSALEATGDSGHSDVIQSMPSGANRLQFPASK
ncbi:MAG: hypothetical protein ABSA69_08135, partial [Verrucomicrobiota bacterium]